MYYHRRLYRFLIVAIFFLLFMPKENYAAQVSENMPQDDFLYEAYSDYYFFKRSIEFDKEMTLREAFLKWLLDGIVIEAADRRKEDAQGTLQSIDPPELKGMNNNLTPLPEDFNDLPRNQQYSLLESNSKEEYQAKFLRARLIKSKLIKSSNPTQRQRMFNEDLKSAIFSYRDGFYSEAILEFTELIESYGYRDIEDIHFFRGESYYALQLYHKAEQDYKKVIESNDSDGYKVSALSRLLMISGDRGDISGLAKYLELIKQNTANDKNQDFWQIEYNAALYFMYAGQFQHAMEVFDTIPTDFPNFINAKYFAAQCALMLVDLDDAEGRFYALTQGKLHGKKVSAITKNKATLKLGYVDFLRGDYDLAFVNFTKVKGDSTLLERSQIASAWALYHIGMTDKSYEMVNQFKTTFPNSEYLFEAEALVGYCREIAGDDSSALKQYEEILFAMDDRQDYRNFNYERNEIIRTIAAMTQLEPIMFEYNRKDLFPRYLELRKSLGVLTQKIRMIEGYKSNPGIAEMIAEQARLMKTIQDQKAFEDELVLREKGKLITKLEDVYDDLYDIAEQIDLGVKYELSKRNLIQREEKQRFQQTRVDSLKSYYNREIAKLDQTLTQITQEKQKALDQGDDIVYSCLTDLEYQMNLLQNSVAKVNVDLRNQNSPDIDSQLDTWSDFAYQRRQYGGLKFDEFYARQTRVDQLDQYVQKLTALKNSRINATQDTVSLPADLLPASAPGMPTHFAPPMPLWESSVISATIPTEDEVAPDLAEPSMDAEPENDVPELETPSNEGEIESEGSSSIDEDAVTSDNEDIIEPDETAPVQEDALPLEDNADEDQTETNPNLEDTTRE